MCSHKKTSQWVLIKDSQHSSQNQEVKNGFKTSYNLIYTPSNMLKAEREKRERKKRIRKDKKKESNNSKKI